MKTSCMHAGMQACRQAGRQAGRQQAGRQAYRQTDMQVGRQAYRQAGRQAGRQAVITILLVLPGSLGRSFHPSLYLPIILPPSHYYTTYSMATGTTQKDKDHLLTFHSDIHLYMTL